MPQLRLANVRSSGTPQNPHPRQSGDGDAQLTYWWLQVPLGQLGTSCAMIAVLIQLRSAIEYSMGFLDLYEANVDQLQFIMDILFQPRHALRVTNTPPKGKDPSLKCTLYFHLHPSHHVFFDIKPLEVVHKDCRLSINIMFRCRELIPVSFC